LCRRENRSTTKPYNDAINRNCNCEKTLTPEPSAQLTKETTFVAKNVIPRQNCRDKSPAMWQPRQSRQLRSPGSVIPHSALRPARHSPTHQSLLPPYPHSDFVISQAFSWA